MLYFLSSFFILSNLIPPTSMCFGHVPWGGGNNDELILDVWGFKVSLRWWSGFPPLYSPGWRLFRLVDVCLFRMFRGARIGPIRTPNARPKTTAIQRAIWGSWWRPSVGPPKPRGSVPVPRPASKHPILYAFGMKANFLPFLVKRTMTNVTPPP